MIIFDLICEQHHIFEGWFSSSDDYEAQKRGSLLCCPTCGSDKIVKSVMAPNIGLKTNQRPLAPERPSKAQGLDQSLVAEQFDAPVSHSNASTLKPARQALTAGSDAAAALDDKSVKAITSALVKAQNEALKQSTWVGGKFAQEARAIYYGEADKRQIHGHATHNEVADLQEEGIAVAALPMPFIPPDLKN